MSESQPLRIPLHGFQQDDAEHSKWAKNYLAKKGVTYFRFSDPEDEDSAECVIIPLQDGYENIDYNDIYKNMPLAWSQRKRRQESGLKHYSFFMDEGVGSALNRLAIRRRSTMSSALEALILEEKDLAAEYEKDLKNSQKEYREWYKNKGDRQQKLLGERNRKQIKRLWSALEELAYKIATYETSDQFDHTAAPDPGKASGALIKKKEEILKHYRDSIEPGSSDSDSEAPSPPEATEQEEFVSIDQELVDELKNREAIDSPGSSEESPDGSASSLKRSILDTIQPNDPD